MSSRSTLPLATFAFGLLALGAGCSSAPAATPAGTTPTATTGSNTRIVTIKPMAGFKVYENSKEKFAMQYPEAWTVTENSFNTIVSFRSPLTNKDDKFSENVNVVSEVVGDKSITLDQYYKVSEENLKKFFSDFKLIKNESTTLSGSPARMVIYSASQSQLKLRTTQIFTIKDGKAYIVTLTNTQSEPNQYLQDMLKISQSFQFTP